MALISSQILAQPLKKIPPYNSQAIIKFTLFNYDPIIQDHFEGTSDYLNQLIYLLQSATQLPQVTIQDVVYDGSIYTESNPVQFMTKLNQKLKYKSGYYFVDD